MADQRGLPFEGAHHTGKVIGYLAHGFAREDLWMGARIGDRRGVVRPARLDCAETRRLEKRRPPVPAAGQKPEAVDEHHGSALRRVGTLDLLV